MIENNKKPGLAEKIKSTPHDKLIKNIWLNLEEKPYENGMLPQAGTGKWQWLMISMHVDDIYGALLSEQEYYEIAKFAAKLWAMEEGHRVRADKLTPNHYYEVCKIMAQQGVFTAPEYKKLQQARIKGVPDPVRDIVVTALRNLDNIESSVDYRRKHIFEYFAQNDIYAMFLRSEIKTLETNLITDKKMILK